eukprot:757861-Alexandrium_andersonii.AAC.1
MLPHKAGSSLVRRRGDNLQPVGGMLASTHAHARCMQHDSLSKRVDLHPSQVARTAARTYACKDAWTH